MMNINAFFLGMRPKTLVAAFIPPLCAYAIYRSVHEEKQILLFLSCVFFALFIQIATNFYNDGIDFVKGADENRVGPKRMTSESMLSYKSVMRIGHLFILLSALACIPLVLEAGSVVIPVALISMYLAYGYTGGPLPLAYLGLGELFVFIFFGLVSVCGTFFILSGTYSIMSILLGVCVGFLSCVLIAVNNFRDRKTDILVNKRTLATKLSERSYLMLLDFFMFTPHIIMFGLAVFYKLSFVAPLLSISFAHKTRYVLHNHNKEEELNTALKLSGIHLLCFGVLFSLGTLWK